MISLTLTLSMSLCDGEQNAVTRELYRTIALKIGPTNEAGKLSIGATVGGNKKAA